MRLIPTIEVSNVDFFKKLGPEPLSDDFTQQVFSDRLLRRPNTNIKASLLDQSVIAGVGNIYADESLWAAKIHPASIVKSIPRTRMNNLFKELREVLVLSIAKGGSTDRNYVDAEGKKIGFVTSGTQSPTLQKAIGMGYVTTNYAKEGSEIFIAIRDKSIKAAVVKTPFIK